jgi:elongation factor G
MKIENLRNIGISAHIDSGKTTLTEHILFYAGKIHATHEVKGKDGVGATMDFMELEKERGITITSAATNVAWGDHELNIIDTPGHVDFTIEVERSLRVLDGAILVLCAVGGVQSQSITVDRQMKRYKVPRIAFINKCDRSGANPERVTAQLREQLNLTAVMLQIPIGLEDKFAGVVDLIEMKAIYFEGLQGEILRETPIPADLQASAHKKREELLDAVSLYSDQLTEAILEGRVTPDLIRQAVRRGTLDLTLVPVMMGTAFKKKGIQPLLDAVVSYLPSPLETKNIALDRDKNDEPVELKADPSLPTVLYAFKLEDGRYGQLTFIRLYQGTLRKSEELINTRSGNRIRVGRLVRMHADKMEEIDEALAGDIVAVLGVDCASGDTYASEPKYCMLENMFVPEPVIRMAIAPSVRDGADRLSKALHRFRREDPTLHVSTDEETGETIMAGMGELHLDIYVERIRREYNVEVEVGAPRVNYREAPTQAAEFNVRHRKQTGGSGQYAHIVGRLDVLPEDSPESFLFEENVTGGRIPKQFIPAVEKGFRSMLAKGPIAKYPVVGLAVYLEDGSYHEVDSSDMAFQVCAQTAMREAFPRTRPVLLEPVMKVEIECPGQFQGAVVGNLTSRRGIVLAAEAHGPEVRIEGEVPLAETFGYSTDLRSMTQGQGTFTLEFARYKRLPRVLEEELIAGRKKAAMAGTI